MICQANLTCEQPKVQEERCLFPYIMISLCCVHLEVPPAQIKLGEETAACQLVLTLSQYNCNKIEETFDFLMAAEKMSR